MKLTVKKSGRADYALKELEISTRGIKDLFEQGKVQRGRKILRGGDIVQLDDVIDVTLPKKPILKELKIIIEEDEYLVVFKPAGIDSVSVRLKKDSLEEQLKINYKNFQMLTRLDRDTSGLIMVLKAGSDPEKFKIRKKGYFGFTKFAPSLGEITKPLFLKRDSDRVFTAEARDSKIVESVTDILNVKDLKGGKLVEVAITSGTRHQIRAHLGWANSPLIGDDKYGSRESLNSYFPDMDRDFFLQAHKLSFNDGREIIIPCEIE